MSRRASSLYATIVVACTLPNHALAQTRHYALESVNGLRLHNVTARAVTHRGKKGVQLLADTNAANQAAAPGQPDLPLVASIEGLKFSNGVIEAEVAGAPASGADTSARGFVGIAFRTRDDDRTYDAFYLRPTNGRANDQERRNHSAQYISHPDWPWYRLRRETPSRYEAYVDLVPDAWTKVRIEVHGAQARLYVNGQLQPTLIVNDLKTGSTGEGGIALWIGPGTSGHFRSLTVTPAQ